MAIQLITCATLLGLLYLLQVMHDGGRNRSGFYLSPLLLLNIGWVLYGIFPILFLKDLSDSTSDGDLQFLIVIVTTIISWFTGSLLGIAFTTNKKIAIPNIDAKHYIGGRSKFIFIVTIILFLAYYVQALYGGLELYVTQKYGNYNIDGISSAVSATPFIVAGLLFSVLAVPTRIIDLILVFCVAFLFLMGGNRNIFAFIVIGYCYYIWSGKIIKISTFTAFVLVAIPLASFLAVAREFGMGNVLTGNSIDFSISEVIAYAQRYNEGEFGTLYRTFIYVNDRGSTFEYFFPGFSYTLSPIINFVPTFIYPERPNTIASEFTFHYWGGKADFIEGLGFSPIAEGLLNFGSLFFVPIFVLSFLLTTISRISIATEKTKSFYYHLFFTCVSAATLNFFRIDFSLYCKFILISYIVGAFAYKISISN